jgi:hypothetical protein
MAGDFYVLLKPGWRPWDPTGNGKPLHHAYRQATKMTFLGMIAGQIGRSRISTGSFAGGEIDVQTYERLRSKLTSGWGMMGGRYAYRPAQPTQVHTLAGARADAQQFANRLRLRVGRGARHR